MDRRQCLGFAGSILFANAVGSASADTLAAMSPAQIALFETAHLATLQPPLRLDYAFRRTAASQPDVIDSIRLRLTAAEDGACCDVSPEFLTGARAIRYPPARGFHGNPLLLFALDRDARELSAATGGTTQWFRNRFRRALAETATLRGIEIEFAGARVDASEITIEPYRGEPRAGRYQACRYAFTIAPAVPGWIAGIRTELPAFGDTGPIAESIVFVDAVAGTEATR